MKVRIKKECNEIRFRLFGKNIALICDDQEVLEMDINEAMKIMKQLHEMIAMYIAMSIGQESSKNENRK
ncbi:MAG: hypothetical protein DRJ40_11510 [Thermoprotei archaeon]|nr:MAG: hypothetical protein DRJ40_11510 [Thermoprotei archaeon]